MKRLGSTLAFSACGVFLVLSGSCTGQGSPYDDVPWVCFEDSKSCGCYGGTRAEGAKDPRASTTSCRAALECCFVIDLGDGAYDCQCIKTPADSSEVGGAGAGNGSAGVGGEGEGMGLSAAARCTRAATEHNTTEVVAHCPPVTLDSSAVCSTIFESCSPVYLKKNGLIACCDGLVCAEDPNGQPVCVGSNDDQGS